ncbi:hypothetical protein Cgig2_031150 [Carnegiea gigantea]|uniref:Uncharacterized protein n=1 Tax=Carnegiea gigantea TaxID=171969 RepID=A0A9Q1QMA9_9CARY|nr:hypothetical protein Cgig2_031150 [Carnegiea gigantea]
MQGLFKMVTFMDKVTSGQHYLHIQPSENDVDGEETKWPIYNSTTSLCKSDCARGRTSKPTIEQWIAFWFQGCNMYHVARKPDQDSRIPHLGILSSIIDAGAHEWGDCQIICDGLGLYIFILPVRDAGCIRPDTFSVASFMTLGVGYCLPIAIFASIYKGLNEISRSSHPGRGRGYFPAHFLYA